MAVASFSNYNMWKNAVWRPEFESPTRILFSPTLSYAKTKMPPKNKSYKTNIREQAAISNNQWISEFHYIYYCFHKNIMQHNHFQHR